MAIVLTPTVNTTQSILFDDMVDDIAPYVPACPDPVIARTAHKVISDMCQRAKVWHEDFLPVDIKVGQVAYPLLPPVANAVCTDVTSAYTLIGGRKTVLTWEKLTAVKQRFADWPEGSSGSPRHITSATLGEVLLAPVPDAVGTLNLRGYLRPSATATGWDLDLYNEFQRVIFHGTMYDLMLMNGRAWAEPKLAALHGKHWTQLLASARDRALRGYNTDDLAVQMQPFA